MEGISGRALKDLKVVAVNGGIELRARLSVKQKVSHFAFADGKSIACHSRPVSWKNMPLVL